MSHFVIAIFVSLALFSKCEAELIDKYCSKSSNPTLCNQALRSDPRSKGADARVLAEIAIEKAEAATHAAIQAAKRVGNARNKEIIDTCIENFDSTVDQLEISKSYLKKRDGFDVTELIAYGSAALGDVDTCSDEFEDKEPPQLKYASEKAYALVELLLIIAKTI